MQLSSQDLDDYVANVAQLAERYGVVLELAKDGPIELAIELDGTLRFNLVGFLLDGRHPPIAQIHIDEKWRVDTADRYERTSYRYELLDRERGFRRAFHRHDEAVFVRYFGVTVHEHCESPIGYAACPHHFGSPVRDAYRAVELLMAAWVTDPPDCAALPCLEPI